jgi:hypothetical protein
MCFSSEVIDGLTEPVNGPLGFELMALSYREGQSALTVGHQRVLIYTTFSGGKLTVSKKEHRSIEYHSRSWSITIECIVQDILKALLDPAQPSLN